MSTTIEHAPSVHAYPRTSTTPAEVTVTCTCGWEWFSQESAGGGLEPWGPAFDAHATADICHQEIVDADGYLDACNAPATTTRTDEDGDEYPVCEEHKEAA